MGTYRVQFTETKTRTGWIEVEADSPQEASEKVGGDYRYGPSVIMRKAKANKSLTHYVDTLYPQVGVKQESRDES